MNWSDFVAIPNGAKIANHGGDQCVALANLYNEDVIGGSFVPVASAYQWWTEYGRFPQLTTNYAQVSPGENPKKGDIFISRGGMYNSQHGHIGVVIRDWDGSTFGTKEQNAELNRYSYQTYNRTKQNMLGYLRPKNNPANITDTGDFMRVTWDNTGIGYVVTEDGFYGLANFQEYQLFVRLINSTPAAPDTFTQQEIQVMGTILSSIAKRNAGTGSNSPAVEVDYAKIAKTVLDEEARRLQQ